MDFKPPQETSKLKSQSRVHCLNYGDKRFPPLSLIPASPAYSKPAACVCSMHFLLATEGRKRREGEPYPHPERAPVGRKRPLQARMAMPTKQSEGKHGCVGGQNQRPGVHGTHGLSGEGNK